jgi:hypothetical protein
MFTCTATADGNDNVDVNANVPGDLDLNPRDPV